MTETAVVGIDFDNTIVCYDALFHKIAVERGLIPAEIPVTKEKVRDHLRGAGKEDAWTELQGHVYGPGMENAVPFPGAIDFLIRCRRLGIPVHIISHRTRHPFLGPKHDLHRSARRWMEKNGFLDPNAIGLRPEQIHLELTKEAKLKRIAEAGCTHFIEDLPEFLEDPKFPRTVRRILFDPSGNAHKGEGITRVRSWVEIGKIIGVDGETIAVTPAEAPQEQPLGQLSSPPETSPGDSSPRMASPRAEMFPRAGAQDILDSRFRGNDESFEIPQGAVADLLAAAGRRGKFTLHPLGGAANNRVFRVDANGERYLLKAYFRHPRDLRDRLGTEFAFSQFAWNSGVRALPRPMAFDPRHHLGLYEFIEGRRLRPNEVTRDAVDQALKFYLELNRHRTSAPALALPEASEACFSISDHLNCTERRLKSFSPAGDFSVDADAADFILGDLSPAWDSVLGSVRQEARKLDISLEETIPTDERRLSPSDFGFHNALRTPEGGLRFIDFEYAGWDDPAKTVCDFFCQPEVPVSEEFYPAFVDAVIGDLSSPETERRRIALLLPVYQVKWCCILLNDFLPAGGARRRFAQGEIPAEDRKAQQLKKAREFLKVCRVRSTGVIPAVRRRESRPGPPPSRG